MDVIDEDGRLFGAVNVVDALVVLVVFAIALAGIALVTGEGPAPETGERYVTLDFGTQPSGVAEELDVGDTSPLAGELGNLTITDTYMMTSDSGVRVFARVAVTGRTTERQFTFDGEPLRIGRRIQFQNDTYVVNGTIQNVGNATGLPVRERTVVLRDTVPAGVAQGIERGEEITAGGRTTGTVNDVAVYDARGPDRRTVYVEATLQTLMRDGAARFGGTPVEAGRTIRLPVAGSQYNGTVERVGGGLDRRTDEAIVTGVVDADTAAQLTVGDTYSVAGQEVATIRNLTVYDTGTPDRKRVYAGLSVRTLGFGEEPRFGSVAFGQGATVRFGNQSYEFDASVVRYGTADLRTGTEEVLVTDVVDVDIADRLAEGDTYTVAGQPVATVESLVVYGTDDPDRKRIYVGLSLRTVGFGEFPKFGVNQSVREGATIPFRTRSYELAGEIVRVGTLEQPGDPAERTLTLRMENVPPERADSVEQGLTETNGGQTVAEVLDVQVEPAVVTLTSEDGEIFEREHPVNKDVTLTVELQVREQASGIRFKGRILQEGNEIVFDLGTTTVRATVVELEA
ncbi:hypothetical protein BRC78_08995 [Halobacteriales archaeon QH_8_68_33]|nr:MAG: hypothetical protein BRC78_08995 [Halobacteriales archaeon QH_8_68_33]